ncbi:MAG: hypothetical protein AAGH74_13205 [Pseudomonadota bacterium]
MRLFAFLMTMALMVGPSVAKAATVDVTVRPGDTTVFADLRIVGSPILFGSVFQFEDLGDFFNGDPLSPVVDIPTGILFANLANFEFFNGGAQDEVRFAFGDTITPTDTFDLATTIDLGVSSSDFLTTFNLGTFTSSTPDSRFGDLGTITLQVVVPLPASGLLIVAGLCAIGFASRRPEGRNGELQVR